MSDRKPNIYDVAKLAGVSHQTVSRVVNDHPHIRETTKQKVEAAMAQLGYVPSHAARSLVTARTRMIGILAADTFLFGPSSELRSIESEARRAGYVAISCSIDAESEAAVRDGVQHLLRLGVEGMVVITPQARSATVESALHSAIPVVVIGSMSQSNRLSVSVDGLKGASQATQHLIDLGHRNILHIVGPVGSFDAAQRAEGYRQTMQAAGLKARTVQGDWAIETGYRLGLATDFAGEGITAVFAANDHLALGLLKACRERGINVPAELSVVGFDDIPEAAYLDPPLTTLHQDFRALGQQAVQLMVGVLADEPNLASRVLPPSFILRESTAPPARR